MQKVGFKGSLKDFFTWLRTDPQFFYSDPRALFEAYQATAKRIDPKLVLMFHTLAAHALWRRGHSREHRAGHPRRRTTASRRRRLARRAPSSSICTSPRRAQVGDDGPDACTRAFPGHHLQFALASEQKSAPRLPPARAGGRRSSRGGALYAESLGDEMGLYDDPYAKFGQLTYEMWRAVRLVVDTGMHAMHWDRKRAIDYFLDNTPKTELDVTNEVDRYIVWPGQALAYKIGQLEDPAPAGEARAALGARASTSASSTTSSCAMAPCPSTCWRSRSRHGLRGPGRATSRRRNTPLTALCSNRSGCRFGS